MGTYQTYHYEGPLPLGSVVAQRCSAVGLFSQKENPRFLLFGTEHEGRYFLTLNVGEERLSSFEGSATYEGREKIGKELLQYMRKYMEVEGSPWGLLVGVRPVKLYHRWREEMSPLEVKDRFKRLYQVEEDKANLVTSIGKIQESYISYIKEHPKHIGVYGGIPFCTTRCTYCSFPYGLISQYKKVHDFVTAFVKDAAAMSELIKNYDLKTDSLYLGGGTPTSLDGEDFERVLTAFAGCKEDTTEFTVEAGRPDTVTKEKLEAIVRCGANRISINPQTLQDSILKVMGRLHKADDIGVLYKTVRKQTALQVNMDFIAGLPGQTTVHMKENMEQVCQWLPENVTIHTLALKKGSPMYEGRDHIMLPAADEVREMTEYCREKLETAGYRPYYLYRQQYMTGQLENVGYALPDKESRYNIQMMEERQIIMSMGPGSVTKLIKGPLYRQSKMHMPKDVDVYVNTLEELIKKRQQLVEHFMESE